MSERSGGSRLSAWLSGWGVGLRHAARVWTRRPGLTLMALVVIALGVGSTSAIFTVVDTVLFRPLPHREPERLVRVFGTQSSMAGARLPLSYPNLVDLQSAENTGLEGLAAFRIPYGTTARLTGDAETIRVMPVGGNFFDLLGNTAVIGRTIGASDAVPGGTAVVLSHGLWQSHFGGEAGVLGRTVQVGQSTFEIVGVMPADFSFLWPADLWVPVREDPAAADRDLQYLQAVGRLGSGVTRAEASSRLGGVMARLTAAYPEDNEGKGVQVDDLRELMIGDARTVMNVLLGAVVLLLVLACASVANLLLARISGRQSELAVRGAMGAGRSRLLVQLLSESVLLALAGGVAGIVLAWGLTSVLVDLAPASLPRREAISLDARSLLFLAGTTVLSGLLFGLMPALRASSARTAQTFRQAGRGIASSAGQRLLRGLVVFQFSVALVLLVGGGLLVRSFVQLSNVNPGFDASGVFTMRVNLPNAQYDEVRVRDFFAQLVDRAAQLPGVESAGAIWALPFDGDWASGRVTAEGQPRPHGQEAVLGLMPVAGDYFGTLRIRLIEGRTFTAADHSDSTYVAVLNESAARMLWPDGSAVGRRFKRGRANEDLPWATVIGVVADAKRMGLDAEANPEIYWPHRSQSNWATYMNVVARTEGDPAQLASPLRQLVRELDPDLAPARATRLSDLITASVAEPRFRTWLLGIFAAAALLLALAGIYGVMAFSVTRRTQEIGVRMALGAGQRRVLGEVLRQGGTLVLAGIVLGMGGALVATRAIASLLFGIGTLDAATWATVILVITLTAMVACWLPARRASRVDPAVAMRDS